MLNAFEGDFQRNVHGKNLNRDKVQFCVWALLNPFQ